MSDSKRIMLLTFVLLPIVFGDIYLHNPRGSNNRLNEQQRERNSANRLFDSQNNNRGGYNVGPQPVYYYAGSKVQIEWTNQHSCANKNSHCELILQYMCNENVRDGNTTTRIPTDKTQCTNGDCNTDKAYGMNEDYLHYVRCSIRERNYGLFTADQDMSNRNTAVSTRQENNGKNNRYGYECTEERDYYPYWHYSPWKDIAVLTNNVQRCKYYMAESANVKSRWECVLPDDKMEEISKNVKSIPNNKLACESFSYPANGTKGVWKEFPAHGLSAPDCRETELTRDNHLGNGVDGTPNRYNWTVPDIDASNCVFRIRYNISTNDYDSWTTFADFNQDVKTKLTKIDLSQKYGFENMSKANARGYIFKGDPEIKIFDEGNFNFRLALDTSQYGRTFQDRSHVFSIKKRPQNLTGVTIHNVNVRGKRGNIVQVYPAVEYDFVPNTLEMRPGEYVHFQWTGSDTNNQENNGQGKKGSDRNNVLLLRNSNYPEGNGIQYGPAPTFGHYGNNYPMHLNDSRFLQLSKEDLIKLAFLEPAKVGKNLDEASPHFDLGPRQVNQLGTYYYVSTRNNDFSNRDQKGRILVSDVAFTESAIGYLGGTMILPNGAGSIHVDEGVFDNLKQMRLEVWPRKQANQKMDIAADTGYVSDFLVVYPQSSLACSGKYMSVSLKIEPDASHVAIYRTSSDSNFAMWTKLDTEIDGSVAKFTATMGGIYVAKSHTYTVLIVALTLSILAVAVIIVAGIFYFKRNPGKWSKLKSETKAFSKGFKDNV